jgi:hypothetical protein
MPGPAVSCSRTLYFVADFMTPRVVVSHITCPPLSSSPHANSFVIGSAVMNNNNPATNSSPSPTRQGRKTIECEKSIQTPLSDQVSSYPTDTATSAECSHQVHQQLHPPPSSLVGARFWFDRVPIVQLGCPEKQEILLFEAMTS